MTETVHANGVTPTTASSGSLLEVVHLHKEFPLRRRLFGPKRAVHAVEDATLSLTPGRVTALVGESGSGKTTVARLLARMYPITSGDIFFRGKPLAQSEVSNPHAYRRQVQLVFQDPFASLNPVHTVKYHLSRPLRMYRHFRGADEVRREVLALLERVSLTPAEQFIEKYPHELSGGQRQRVAIARALAASPSVLLADEPVSMLDVSIRLGVLNLLMSLKDEQHLALLYITHDIASARYFADETHVMYAGQMVEGGPSEEVIQRPKHPYTQLLISAAPDPDRMHANAMKVANGTSTTAPETVVRGEPPSLIDPPSGCRFHPRCPHVMPVCRERFPTRTDLGGGHWTHCFLYDQGSTNAAATSPALNASKELS